MPADKGGHEGNASIPDHFEKYLDSLRSEGRTHSEQAEREAYTKMQSQIAGEKNGEVRQFMQEMLEHYCQDCSMLLSYIYENLWHGWIKERRSLQKQVQPIELFVSIELILASQCDSSGYTKTYGPRYPLTIPGNFQNAGTKRVRNLDANVPRARFLNSYYEFGVHRFRVGHAIKKILDHLEKRYGLDFKKLERAQRAGKRNADSG
jgi:hypothetical protein